MSQYQLIPDLFEYYNPLGNSVPTTTGQVTYDGTPKTGGGTNNASYSIIGGETVSTNMVDVFNEFHTSYLRIQVDENNIATNTTNIAANTSALGSLKTGSVQYNGTEKTPGAGTATYGLSTNEVLSAILGANWDEFTLVYAAIAAVTTGVSQAALNNTIGTFVSDFSTGLNNTMNAGLVVTIASGKALVTSQYTVYAGGNITVTATKDNWVYLKTDGTLTFIAVTISSGKPATPANSYVLWKITTNSTTVTGFVDWRNPYPFTGGQLALASIPANAFADNTISLARLQSSVTDKLLPTTSSTGNTLVSNGSEFVENTSLTIDANKLGVGKSPSSTGDFNGSITISTDGTTNSGTVDMESNRLGYYDPSKRNILRSTTTPDPFTLVTMSPYTALVTDYVIGVNVVGPVTITLPNPVLVPQQTFTITDLSGAADANTITIGTAGGTINGSATKTITTPYGSKVLFNDGVNWVIISCC